MKRFVSCLVGIAVVGLWVGLVFAGEENSKTKTAANLTEPWQKDWKAFVGAWNATPRSGKFCGAAVQWRGKIDSISAPKGEKKASVTLDMEPLKVSVESEEYRADFVIVTPKQEEWDNWSDCKKGETVVFQAKLRDLAKYGMPSAMVIKTALVVFFQEGAALVRVVGDDGQVKPDTKN